MKLYMQQRSYLETNENARQNCFRIYFAKYTERCLSILISLVLFKFFRLEEASQAYVLQPKQKMIQLYIIYHA